MTAKAIWVEVWTSLLDAGDVSRAQIKGEKEEARKRLELLEEYAETFAKLRGLSERLTAEDGWELLPELEVEILNGEDLERSGVNRTRRELLRFIEAAEEML